MLDRIGDGLAARGHDCRRYAAAPAAPGEAGAALARLDGFRRHLEGEWRAWRPDVAHVDQADDLGFAAARAATALAVPVTARFHRLHVLAPPAEREALLSTLLGFHRDARTTIAQTPAQERWLRDRGAAATWIPNGVDARRFHPRRRDASLRTSWGAAEADPVLLWVGRLVTEKSPHRFAEAALAARAADPRTRAVVVGDGPEAAALRTALPWARFAGVLEGDALAAAYASADLLVATGDPDGVDSWGNVVAEGLASGIAVVSPPVGAAEAFVAPDGGRVVEPAALASAAADLVVAGMPALRAAGAAGRARVAHATWSACADAWAGCLRAALGAR